MKNHILNFISITIFIIFSNQAHAVLASSGSVYLKANTSDFFEGVETKEATLTHGIEGIFSIESNFEQGASVTFEDSNFWSFEFAAPTYDPITNTNNGNPLKVGFYNHATDFPSNSPTRPGISFFGSGWDNFYNDPDAWFDVVAIEYGTDNEVLSLAIDFLQFDKTIGPLEASTFGSLRINSNIGLNFSGEALSQVPVPTAIWLFGSGLLTLLGLPKRRK